MSRDLEAVLAAIDGALADPDLPDGMRWSPEPGSVTDASPVPFDGQVVPTPPQSYIEDVLPGLLDAEERRRRGLPWSDPASDPAGYVRRMAQALSPPTPEDLASLRAMFTGMAEQLRPILEGIGEVFRRMAETVPPVTVRLRDAGLLPDEGPDRVAQPFERAMWARARQGTGPDRQVQHRPRPRRHQ